MTLDKIKEMARAEGVELTDEQAKAALEKYGTLSDDELDQVAGGGWFSNLLKFFFS